MECWIGVMLGVAGYLAIGAIIWLYAWLDCPWRLGFKRFFQGLGISLLAWPAATVDALGQMIEDDLFDDYLDENPSE